MLRGSGPLSRGLPWHGSVSLGLALGISTTGQTPPADLFGSSLPARLPDSLGDGGTIYISPTGSDTSGDGSIGNPYFTPHKAFSVVALTGGLILARGGTYNLSGTGDTANQVWNRNGSHTNPPQIKAYPGESPIFSGSRILVHNSSGSAGGLRIGPGLAITNSGYDGIKTESSVGYVEIVGCEVYGNTNGNGILIQYNSTFEPTQVQIWDSVFHGNGSVASSLYHGVYFGHADSTCLLANCVFYDNARFAAQMGPESNNLIVTCCTSYSDGNASNGGGFVIWTQSPQNANPGVRMFGCISTDTPFSYAYSFSGLSATDAPEIHDSIWNNAAIGGIEPQTGLVTSNILEADPLYVDAASRDLRLGASSPAVDFVASSHYGFIPATDILGNPRLTADAGAYAKES